jgi:hypothetical protein
LAGSTAEIYFLSATLSGALALQYGVRVTVIKVAAAPPHLSTEGAGWVAVRVGTPLFMRPTTCHVTVPQFVLDIISEPVMSSQSG